MSRYIDGLNDEVKKYFGILSPYFPEWLDDYIETKEMQRIGKISMSCGMDYSKCFDVKYFYSNLDHSVGVALIIWNFTHDKTQTLAGLFHDIATPVFKHCIDFMNGDSETQESTEEKTYEILSSSKEIMDLLKRDGILLEEVVDYKKYPIADNESPKLSADRLEYNFSSGLTFHRVWDLENIKRCYTNIFVSKNEEGEEELAFKDKTVCEEYIKTLSNLWPKWIDDNDRTCMMFIADICKLMKLKGYLTIEDLYTMSESEIIDRIINCEDEFISNLFKAFQKQTQAKKSDDEINDRYCIKVKSKVRYLNPLVISGGTLKRIKDASYDSEEVINNFLSSTDMNHYTYFDFPIEDNNYLKLIKS